MPLQLSHFVVVRWDNGVVGPSGHALALTCSAVISTAEALPSLDVLRRRDRRYYDPLGLPLRSCRLHLWLIRQALSRRGQRRRTSRVQAGVQSNAAFLTIGIWLGRLHIWNALPNGKRAGFYSITALRRSDPDAFKSDLAALFALVESGKLTQRIAHRLRIDDVADAHRRLEAGGLDGKLNLDPMRT